MMLTSIRTSRARGRVRLLELGAEAARRWKSRGGRPTAPEWDIRRLVPFHKELWDEILASARTVGLTAGQVAALLVERGSRGLAWNGTRELLSPTWPPGAPPRSIANEPPPLSAPPVPANTPGSRSGIAAERGTGLHPVTSINTATNPRLPATNLSAERPKRGTSMKSTFVSDIEEIRRRARAHIESGPVTEGYRADVETVVRLLNEALATELVCVLRYRRHHFMAKGINSEPVAAEFLEHANEEQGHADLIAARITQLGGEPNFDPAGLTSRSHAEYIEGKTLLDMIREDLVAERIAIDSYSAMIRYLGENDPTTRRMLEEILAVEEEHADDLANLLQQYGPPNAVL